MESLTRGPAQGKPHVWFHVCPYNPQHEIFNCLCGLEIHFEPNRIVMCGKGDPRCAKWYRAFIRKHEIRTMRQFAELLFTHVGALMFPEA